MPETITREADPRIGELLQSIMDEGSDSFEMVGYRGIRVIKDPPENFKVLVEVDIQYDAPTGDWEDTLKAGWNGTYDELFESSERKTKLLKIFYDETFDLIGDGEDDFQEY